MRAGARRRCTCGRPWPRSTARRRWRTTSVPCGRARQLPGRRGLRRRLPAERPGGRPQRPGRRLVPADAQRDPPGRGHAGRRRPRLAAWRVRNPGALTIARHRGRPGARGRRAACSPTTELRLVPPDAPVPLPVLDVAEPDPADARPRQRRPRRWPPAPGTPMDLPRLGRGGAAGRPGVPDPPRRVWPCPAGPARSGSARRPGRRGAAVPRGRTRPWSANGAWPTELGGGGHAARARPGCGSCSSSPCSGCCSAPPVWSWRPGWSGRGRADELRALRTQGLVRRPGPAVAPWSATSAWSARGRGARLGRRGRRLVAHRRPAAAGRRRPGAAIPRAARRVRPWPLARPAPAALLLLAAGPRGRASTARCNDRPIPTGARR